MRFQYYHYHSKLAAFLHVSKVDECLAELTALGEAPSVIGALRPLPQPGCEQVRKIMFSVLM